MAYASVRISANSSDYQSQMKSAAAQMKMLSSEYSVAATKAKLFGKEADVLKAKAKSLTERIETQKKIVKFTGEEQQKLTDKLSEQKEEQAKLAAKVDAATNSLKKSTKETGANSEQSEKLRKKLGELEGKLKAMDTAVAKTETSLTKQTAAANRAKVNLMQMESELKEVNKQLKNHGFDKFAKACESAGKKMDDFGKKASIVSGGITAVGVAVGKMALDTENGLKKMQGQLGLTTEETEKLQTVANNLYENGFGENLEDCAATVVTLNQNIKDAKNMTVEQQQAISEQMMTMHELFETENEELTKTLATMVNNGVVDSISEGMDVLTVGFQNGANYSGELLDTMREYSPKFKELGLDAESAMAYLIQGANNGAFNLDKVGDAMKEFSIRAVDGSDSTAEGFAKIGLNADEMSKKFAAGGDSASQAFKESLVALNGMTDPIEQNAAGVALFGTTWEDLGKDVILSLADVEGSLENVDGATAKAGEQINSSFSTEAKTQFRELQMSVLPLGNELLRLGQEAMPTVKEAVEKVTTVLETMDSETAQTVITVGAVAAAVGPVAIGFGKAAQGISSMVKVGQAFASGVSAVVAKITAKTAATAAGTAADAAATATTTAGTAATVAHTTATTAGTVATTAFGVAMKALQAVGVVAIITAIIAAIIWLVKNWDTVKEKATEVWSHIKEKFNQIKESITGAFNNAKEAAKNKLAEMRSSIESTPIGKAAMKVFDAYTGAVKKTMTAAIVTAKEKLGNMKTAYEEAGGGLKGVVAAGMEGVKGYYTAGITFVDNLTGGKLTEVKNKWSEGFTNIKNKATSLMDAAKENVSARLNNIKTAYEENGGGIKGIAAASFTAAKDHMVSIMSTADKLTGGKLTSIKNAFTDKLNAAKSTVTSIMEKIRTTFTSKIEAARTAVRDAIDKIKGFFDFEWSFPELKMPHFNITGEFSLNPPSAPKFEIEWYKSGGIMTSPTVFGMNGSRLMVGGEAGAEAILPLSEFYARLNQILNQKLNAIEKPAVVYVNYNADGVIGKLQEVKDSLDKKATVVQVEVIPDDRGIFRVVKRVNDREIELTGNNPLNPVGGK